MGRVLSNNISLAYAIEDSLGVLPGSPTWRLLEPNSLNTFGSDITTVSRTPISKNRQRKKGTTTDLDSAVEFEADVTMDHSMDFMEGFMFAVFNGPAKFGPMDTDDVTAVTATGYTVAANGDVPDGTLVYAKGFTTAANNGLKVTAGTSITTEVKAAGLVAEGSPPTNATLEICGVEGASADLQIDASGDLTSTILDFTTLDLTVGQVIWIGGTLAGEIFADANNTGFARITAIIATKLTLDKKVTTFAVDAGTGKTIRLFFGKFGRNVPVDDVDFIQRSFQFEATFPDLQNPSGDEYEYSIGNYCNQMTFNLPLADKATISFGFTGTDTEDPVTTQKTGASTPIQPVQTVAFNTTSDVARLRITETDETGLTTDFKSLGLTINNNVGPEKVIGTLGAKYMNTGIFEINIEAQLIFTDSDVTKAIRANRTVTMDFSMRNDDGAMFFDIPAMTLAGGGKEFPVNESVLINVTAEAFADPTLDTSIGVSMFPYAPSS